MSTPGGPTSLPKPPTGQQAIANVHKHVLPKDCFVWFKNNFVIEHCSSNLTARRSDFSVREAFS